MREEWKGFVGGHYETDVDVRDFIQRNYRPYEGDASFLEGPTEATDRLWSRLQELQKEERAKGGVLDMEEHVVSSINAYGPAYLSPEGKGRSVPRRLQDLSEAVRYPAAAFPV